MPSSTQIKIQKKRGPRGGKHSDEAREKMRDRWSTRKLIIDIGLAELNKAVDNIVDRGDQ